MSELSPHSADSGPAATSKGDAAGETAAGLPDAKGKSATAQADRSGDALPSRSAARIGMGTVAE